MKCLLRIDIFPNFSICQSVNSDKDVFMKYASETSYRNEAKCSCMRKGRESWFIFRNKYDIYILSSSASRLTCSLKINLQIASFFLL